MPASVNMFTPLRLILDRIVSVGDLQITGADGKSVRFGDGSGKRVAVHINDKASERDIAFDPYLKVGEAYMQGRFVVEEGRIYDFLELVLRNTESFKLPKFASTLAVPRYLTKRLQQFNPAHRSKRNVAHHYDINGKIYDLFLDRDRQYSCAFFEPGRDDLDEAQHAKKRHLLSKLAIKTGDSVLDIGSGWGGLGLYLAEIGGANVTGVTLSEEQIAIAKDRARDKGLQERVRFKLQDYRRVTGPFDRIISVGMFEHVGVNHYQQYFDTIYRLMKDDGVAVIHSIGRSDRPAYTNPFIAKYIFPGGYIPSLSEVLPAIEKSGLYVTDIEILRLHYAETLRHWRTRFLAGWDKAAALLGEEFCRMWEFYLAGSETAFRYQNMMVFQIQLTKKVDALPITRDYMFEEERRLRAREAGQFQPRMAGE